MIGISEGIVLADRYRLVRRQAERAIGATWVATDTQTGSDVWVQFADRGGLAEAADLLGRHAHPAIPTVLDTGELRLVVNSRALAAGEGRLPSQATHVEIVIEFAVLKPLTGRALPPKIARRPLAPAEGLALAAGVAGALVIARGESRSHGWLTAESVWVARRGGCAIDLAQGLAFPDDARIETEQEVTGYFAPERLNGGAASEAADVFALGWLLYETLIGHATLHAEYTRLVAGAGAVTTHELLALWRERARVHVVELLEADSALALLITASLAERAADRPSLDAFASGALEAAGRWKGAAALVGGASAAAAVGAGGAASVAVAGAGAVGAGASGAAGVGLVGAEVDTVTGSGAQGTEGSETGADAGSDADANSEAGAEAGSDVDSDVETATAGQALTLLSEAAAAALVVDGAINLAGIPSQRVNADVASAAVGAGAETTEAAGAEAQSAESPVAESSAAQGDRTESGAADSGAVDSGAAESGDAESAAVEPAGFAGGVQAAPLLAGGVIESIEIIENAAAPAGPAASPRHGRRHRALFSVAAAAILAIFVVGLSVGYAWGHHGTSVQSVAAAGRGSAGTGGGTGGSGGGTGGGGSSGSNTAGAPAVAAAAASASAVCATPAATASGEALSNAATTVQPSPGATGPAAVGQVAPSPSASLPAVTPTLSPLPAPASNAVAIEELVITVERGHAAGVIGPAVTKELLTQIDRIKAAGRVKGEAGPLWTSVLGELALMIENDQQNRTLPTDLANQLSTTLSYLYGSSGS